MKIFERLFDRDPKSRDQLTQTEREAVIDLLSLGVYVDNHLSIAEDEAFDSITEKMNWESKTDITYYINTATERARQARSDEGAVDEFLNYVAERLTSRTSASHALDLLHRLFIADGSDEKENAFYKRAERIIKN